MKFLFDLGGVFFDWNPKHYYQSYFSSKDEMDFFLTNVCNDEWNAQQDRGRLIKDAEYELIKKFPQHSKEIKMYYANHRNMIKKTFQDSIELLLDLKSKNILCYVLSNWSAETFVGMKDDYPFLNKFDAFLLSGEVKLIKPEIAIYELAISRFNLIPEETVFVDDKKENIEAAKKLNFITVHLTDPNKIKIALEEYLN
jgi:2-haloacid dehalogenase